MTLRLARGQAAVRRDGLDGAVERVVAGAALEGLGVELRVQQPVGDGGVVADEAARAAQQVALEVVGLERVAVGVEPRVGGDAGGVEVPVDAGAQVAALRRWRRRFAVLDLVDQDVAVQRARVGGCLTVGDGAAHGLLDRAAQRVVAGGEVVAAAVPGADGLAGHVVQHPARAGLHAELVDAVAEHVVGVAHDDAAERVAGLLDRRRARRAGCLRCPARRGWRSCLRCRRGRGRRRRRGCARRSGRGGRARRSARWWACRRGRRRARRRCCSSGPSAPPMRWACQVCQVAGCVLKYAAT